MTWQMIARISDITDFNGIDASLDVLDSWVLDRYEPRELVRMTGDVC